MIPVELIAFIQKARSAGLADADIRQKLLAAGWKTDAVDAALHPVTQPAPVILPPAPLPPYAIFPTPAPRTIATHPFRGLLSVVVVIMGVLSVVGTVFFTITLAVGTTLIRETDTAADHFLKTVESGDYPAAYALVSAPLQQRITPEAFTAIMQEVVQKTNGTFTHNTTDAQRQQTPTGEDVYVWKTKLKSPPDTELTLVFVRRGESYLLYNMESPVIEEAVASVQQKAKNGTLGIPQSPAPIKTAAPTPTAPLVPPVSASPTALPQASGKTTRSFDAVSVEDGVTLQLTDIAQSDSKTTATGVYRNTSASSKTVYPIRLTLHSPTHGGGANNLPPQMLLAAGQQYTAQYEYEHLPGGSPYTFTYLNGKNASVKVGQLSF